MWTLSHCHVSGAKKLIEKIKEYNPKIAVFNGKGIYEVFSGQKEFIFGKQPEKIEGTETVSINHIDVSGQ
jgi:mismatch-specific thymine-DNA glycosylase